MRPKKKSKPKASPPMSPPAAPSVDVPIDGYLLPRIARAMRERAGVRKSELARRMGVGPSAISQFEKDDNPLREATLRAYAEALQVPLLRAMIDALNEISATSELAD